MTTEEFSELLNCPRDDDGDDDGGDVFWRSPGGYWHPSGTTAWNMIVQMTSEAGVNDDFLDAALACGLPLGEIPAEECVWVTRRRTDAERYNRGDGEDYDAVNPEIYSFRADGYAVIIPDDGDGGVLIWTPGIRSQT